MNRGRLADIKVIALDPYDVRFPTSLRSHGSDAMHPDPDYSVSASLDGVRDIEANSVIFVVTGKQQVTKNGKTTQESKQWAVTVARDGATLRIYAIDHAEDGQAGENP